MCKLGKESVACRGTSYGFLANRAYVAMVKEIIQMVWERVVSPGVIDKALKLGHRVALGYLLCKRSLTLCIDTMKCF